MGRLVSSERRETEACLDPRELVEAKETLVLVVLPVPLVLPDPLVFLDLWALRGPRDRQVELARKETLV